MIPEFNKERLIYGEHLSRYYFASQFVRGRNILDVACGSGYGSHILAGAGAEHVTGGDISNEAIEYATQNFKNTNLEFKQMDGTNIPFKANTFDCIVSFETIEHIQDYQKFVGELRRTLKKDGLLIISSPNKKIYPPGNEYHVKEFTIDEFREIMGKEFKNIQIVYQDSFVSNSLYTSKEVLLQNKSEFLDNVKDESLYFIALCSNTDLPEKFSTANFISQPSEVVSTAVLAEREKHIEILKKDLEHHLNIIKEREETTRDREKHIEILKQEVADRMFNIQELTSKINDLSLSNEIVDELRQSFQLLQQTIDFEKQKYQETAQLLADKERQQSRLTEEILNAQNTINYLQTEISNCELQLVEKQREIDKKNELEERLQQEIQKSEYLYNVKIENEQNLSEQSQGYKIDIERLKNTHDQVIQDIQQNHFDEIHQLESQLASEQSRCSEENKKAEFLFQQCNDKDLFINNLKVELDKERSELDKVTQSLQQSEAHYQEASSKSEYLHAIRIQNEQELQSLREQARDNAMQMDNLNWKIGELQAAQKQSSERVAQLEGTNTRLLESVKDFEILRLKNTEQERQIKEHVNELASLEQIVQHKEEIITQLKSQLDDVRTVTNNLRDVVAGMKLKTENMEQSNSRLIAENETIKLKLLETTAENARLSQDYKYTSDKLSQTMEDLNATRMLRDSINHEYSNLVLKHQSLEIRSKSQAELIASQKQIIASIDNEFTRAEETNMQLSQKINGMQDNINGLNDLVAQKNRNIKELHQEITRHEQKQQELEAETNSLTLQVCDKEASIDTLKKSLSWRITAPVRLFISAFGLLIKPLILLRKDGIWALQLLKREGIGSFIHRFFWYLRGKRLVEEIQMHKNKAALESVNISTDYTEIVFDKVKSPEVSIIIPVYNQWKYTYNCLKSISENTSGISYEIIIADDVSSDETANITKLVKNIAVVRNKKNLGFLLNCNNAARKARGKYVLFLNNDTYVHPEWLVTLRGTFDDFGDVGAAGAKLVYEDGRLQEAGGIVWNDASGWNFGRLADPTMPDYNYAKEVDYTSGACLMVDKELWRDIGGFDTRYVPAYYEDTDIAFEIRKRGRKVMYQPHAVVTHFEGVSNGTDLGSGIKKYQVDNNKKFLEKWRAELESFHFKNAENVFLARDRSRNKKTILVIDHYVPHFDKDAGSRSTFSYLKLLVKMGYNVKFIGDNFFRHEPYTTILEKLGIEVLCGNYYSQNVTTWLKDNGKYVDYVFTHRLHIGPKYFVDLKKHTRATIIFVPHDLQYFKALKEFELTKDPVYKKNSDTFMQLESEVFNSVDIIYPFSTVEEGLIKKLAPTKTVRSLPVYFFENIPEEVPAFEERKDILFVGGFGHPPNIDAVQWLVKEIFPAVRQQIPGVVLHVVGSNPPKEILELKADDINITGYVSDEELLGYYKSCRVSVLPLRVGAGVKGKLLEAMYHQVPTVITPVAAEGVYQVESSSIIAATPGDFAGGIATIYSNQAEWDKYSRRGRALILENYTEENARDLLLKDLKI